MQQYHTVYLHTSPITIVCVVSDDRYILYYRGVFFIIIVMRRITITLTYLVIVLVMRSMVRIYYIDVLFCTWQRDNT